ncbi:MAG: phage GP46 family protein [Rhodobacteraceae bacterium]|nr:phage GP46 family protein [Paracoccaceae bacterium]
MSDVVIRAAEGCAADVNVLWDSVWDAEAGQADWALAGADEAANRGGLRATAAIETAVVLSLFTDRRVDPEHPLAYLADGDVRGYFGDGVDVRDDLGETDLGSVLWLLERAPLTVRGMSITRWTEQFALEALAPLQAQGACVRIEAQAVADAFAGRLDLTVALYGRDDTKIYDRKFDVLWNQVAR